MFFLFSGCAATQLAISKRNLSVQSKMSNTIFLNPVEDSQKNVYVQIKNTSDKPTFSVDAKVREILLAKGYRIVNSLDKAYYLMQANILQIGKMDPSVAELVLSGGFGSSLSGALHSTGMGVAAGGILAESMSMRSMAVGGIVGGVADTLASAVVKDVTYTVITDLQISEKAASGEKVEQKAESELKQGTSSVKKQHTSSQTGWKSYQTRIISTANKVNLDFEEAEPALKEGLANSVAGIL